MAKSKGKRGKKKMFDADNGFFHLVFANPDDDYYVSPGIRTNFSSFLRLKLLDDGFRSLCFIEKTHYDAQHEYRMVLSGGMTKEILEEAPEKKKKLGWLLGKEDPHAADDVPDFGRTTVIEVDPATLCRNLENLLVKMGRQRSFAIVCSFGTFSDCCKNRESNVFKELVARQKSPNHNIMILTGSANAKDHQKYFRRLANPDLDSPSIFRSEELFPNIRSYIKSKTKDGLPNLPKYIHTYSFLRDAFGERMHLFNRPDYDTLCFVVRYLTLRSQEGFPTEYLSEVYAAVAYVWLTNERFRNRYPHLLPSDNPFYEISVVEHDVFSRRFFEDANRIVKEEGLENRGDSAREFVEYWGEDEAPVPILYDAASRKNSLPEIYDCMVSYRRNLKNHEDVLSPAEWQWLDRIGEYYEKPSYSLYEGQATLPHERFEDRYAQQTIQDLFNSLKKQTWNAWDEMAMRLLFVLFKRCYEHAREITEDFTNECGRLEFEKCFEIIRTCLRYSQKFPNETVSARGICAQAEAVLTCKNYNTIRIYQVPEVYAHDQHGY